MEAFAGIGNMGGKDVERSNMESDFKHLEPEGSATYEVRRMCNLEQGFRVMNWAQTRANVLVLMLHLHISPLLQLSLSFLSSWSQMPWVGFLQLTDPTGFIENRVKGPTS